MDLLGDTLTTHPIGMGQEFTIELYLSGQFRLNEDTDSQFYNSSVWTRTRTPSGCPESLLLLPGMGSYGSDCCEQSTRSTPALPLTLEARLTAS
jgi:hypothetical protein